MFHRNVLVKKKEKKRGANDVLYDYNLYDVGGTHILLVNGDLFEIRRWFSTTHRININLKKVKKKSKRQRRNNSY